jgi:hypothetical protein
MLRQLLSSVCLSVLALVAAGPAGCSGPDTTSEGAMQSAAGSGAGKADSMAGGGGGNSDSSGTTGGAAGAADAAGASMGGNAGVPSDAGEAGLGGAGGGNGCLPLVEEQPLSKGVHVTTCSAIDYATNPPSSGQHYPVWAAFGAYDFPLPRGFWVHNLEHGAVVVTYNCPAGCADEVAAATAWLATLSADSTCSAGPPRVLLVPDPKLDVRWAASSWGFTLRSGCFDAAAFSDFYSSHVGKPIAPEAPLCGAGVNFRDPSTDACGAR